ncbi:uncharacterized protein LOC142168921 [Nicotiana tabacum]|uniref:Uncharacterized protein LOC142168921 n=1 Tax=Nicotiana tabacum TaxID=4097 RepID=A0AC58SML2_TOBAC
MENQKKPNLEETEVVNLGSEEDVKETRISIHLEAEHRRENGLSTNILSHRLPTDPTRPPVKYKPRKFKPDLSLRIKEEIAQKLRYYMSAYTTHLISPLNPLKYIFQKPMPTGKLAKWKILLNKVDIMYITQKAIEGQAVANHLIENLVDGDNELFSTYFLDKEILFVGEDVEESYPGWRIFFDRAANFKGVGIGAVLFLECRQHYLASRKIRFPCTNNMAEYEVCILGIRMAVDMNIKEPLVIGDSDLLIHQVQREWSTKNVKILPYQHCVKELCKKFTKIEFKHVSRIQSEFADALATLSSMIQHPDKNYIDPIEVEIRDQHAYCFHVN